MPPVATEAFPSSGYIVPPSIVLQDRTGNSAPSREVLTLDLEDLELPLRRPLRSSEDPGQTVALVGALLGGIDPRDSITAYRTVVIIDPGARTSFAASSGPDLSLLLAPMRAKPLFAPAAPKRPPARTGSAITPADELRTITKLAPARLADLFGISRTAIYKWIEGTVPRDVRAQHLLDVLAHVRDASRRLPRSVDLTIWLQTPVSPGGRSPLDYLKEQRYGAFRGFLVRACSAEMELGAAPSIFPSSSREERALARERLSPRARTEEDEVGPPSVSEDADR